MIFSSRFPVVPVLPRVGAHGEYPPSRPGSLISQPMFTHVALRLRFPKGFKLAGTTRFWWSGAAGRSRWEQQQSIAEHLELRVLHKHSLAGSRAWRT